jgi:hypothetical protein
MKDENASVKGTISSTRSLIVCRAVGFLPTEKDPKLSSFHPCHYQERSDI